MFDRLHALAVAARAFLEPVWQDWHRAWGDEMQASPSKYTCARTSLFLCDIFRQEGLKAHWASGVPRLAEKGPEIGPFGFFSGQVWESHAWCECEGWIVDITADQFGAAPVIVTLVGDERYCRGSAETALPEFGASRRASVDAILPAWRVSRALLSDVMLR